MGGPHRLCWPSASGGGRLRQEVADVAPTLGHVGLGGQLTGVGWAYRRCCRVCRRCSGTVALPLARATEAPLIRGHDVVPGGVLGASRGEVERAGSVRLNRFSGLV